MWSRGGVRLSGLLWLPDRARNGHGLGPVGYTKDMPYLRLTSPPLDAGQRRGLAGDLTDLVVRLLTPPPGRGRPTAEDTRARTTVHFTPCMTQTGSPSAGR